MHDPNRSGALRAARALSYRLRGTRLALMEPADIAPRSNISNPSATGSSVGIGATGIDGPPVTTSLSLALLLPSDGSVTPAGGFN